VAIFLVLHNSNSKSVERSSINDSDSQATNPLDPLSSADIAVSAARMANLAEVTSVVNQADSVAADLDTHVADYAVVSKPQILSSVIKTKEDIKDYTTEAGDTLASLAIKFGVTSDSIKWSNSLSSNTLRAGTVLVIPPDDGIVYNVKNGDTVDSLAAKYSANKDQVTAFNDAEVSGIKTGDKIMIPGGSIAITTFSLPSFSYGGNGSCNFNGNTYSNYGYACGFCTWYAAWRSGAPSRWGDAKSWGVYAGYTPGWTVSKTPKVGAIAQTTSMSWAGHVGIVEAVRDDGREIQYSDMNGIAGFGRVGNSDWVSSSRFSNYIYKQ